MLNEYRLILTLAIIPVLITVACSSDTPTAAPPATSTEVIENALPVPPATATQAPTATPVPTETPQTSEIRSTNPAPTREPTESFTVQKMELEPATGTAFEKLLSLLPDNQATREYTRLGDFAGFVDALGIDRIPPGSTAEERNKYFEYTAKVDVYALYGLIAGWPAEQREYQNLIDTYPDLAFDFMTVEQFARSGDFFFNRDSRPITYDIALGPFDPAETAAALSTCDCGQPEIREHGGIEYFAWGEGDGIGSIKDRHRRPFYDHLGRGPHLLVTKGAAYYTITNGVIDEYIDVIQGVRPSLADAEDYLQAVQWMASMEVLGEITLRNQGFTVETIVEVLFGRADAADIAQSEPLLLPFTLAATGIGHDGERTFAGLVLVHEDAVSAGPNLERLLARIRNVAPAGLGSSAAARPWSYRVDRIETQLSGRFLIAKIYFTVPNDSILLGIPGSLLVHE
ncbi:MAG: hypothetical protein IIC28_06895 [Chloroflexi bacterium]|nr:hypothetical protein [Chloroflexota bacterium]